MNTAAVLAAVPAPEPPMPGPAALDALETRRGSWVHQAWIESRVLWVLLLLPVFTWLPMAMLNALQGLPMLKPHGGLRMPLLLDWNVIFMFCITLPCLAYLLIRDHRQMQKALATVQREATLHIEPSRAEVLVKIWNAVFWRINQAAQVMALCVGLGVAYANWRVYSPADVGHWMAHAGQTSWAGWYFLACIAVFYAMTTLYVCRSLGLCVFLWSLARRSTVRPLPLHPDGSGGLRPVGHIGMRNQLLLTVFGINLILLAWTSNKYLAHSLALDSLVTFAAWAYVFIGPAVFLAPLLPFRGAMMRTKVEVKSEVAMRLRKELRRIRAALPQGELTKADEELVDRLRKVGAVVDELPVWPFDAGTLKKFLAAYLAPMVAFLAALTDLFIKYLIPAFKRLMSIFS